MQTGIRKDVAPGSAGAFDAVEQWVRLKPRRRRLTIPCLALLVVSYIGLFPSHVVRMLHGYAPTIGTSNEYRDPEGMTREAVLAEYGPPHRRRGPAEAEVWSYDLDFPGVFTLQIEFDRDGRVTRSRL